MHWLLEICNARKGENAMNKMIRAICTAVFFAASAATADERTWVGESGGSWYVAANWSPSGVPGETDTVVFSPANELTVTISGGTSVCRAGVIRFESGTTYFAYDSSAVGLYMGSTVTNILHVAEGAEAVLSNRFMTVSGKRFRRTGKGKLTVVPRSNDWWHYAPANDFPGMDFVEGETILEVGTASNQNYPLYRLPIHICSGAVIRCKASYRLRTDQNIVIDRGGVLDMGKHDQYAQSITGEGVVTNHSAVIMTLKAGACTFAGQFFKTGTGPDVHFQARPSGMSDEDWAFVIGGSNTFAKSRLTQPAGAGNTIRFAPGVGDFWIQELIGSTKQYLTLEDTNGDPVTVRGGFYNSTTVPRFKGKGNFLLYSMSAYIRSSDVVTNMTGSLGASGGATLTIGNDTAATWPDISGLGGFIVERGTVAFKNENVEDSTIHGTTVFRDAGAKMTATAALAFGAGSTVRFEISKSGLGSGVTPIKAPTISFNATSALEADVAAYRETLGKKATLKLAEASSALNLPDEVLANANADSFANGYRFRKDGKTLLLDVSRPGGFIITLR